MNDFLAELAVRSLVIAGLGVSLRCLLIRSSAQARAKVLAITMVGLIALPIAMLLAPKVSVTVSQIREVATGSIAASAQTVQATPTPIWGFLWAIVLVLLFAKVTYSLVRFRQVESGLEPASPTLSERVRNFTKRVRQVFFCPAGEPPMTWGVIHPRIALPESAETWQEAQLQSVVLHEEAHIRRHDWAVSMGFRFVTAIYWFNPLVWALRWMFEQDSERAADDFVLAQGLDAPDYAERILEVAQALQPKSGRLPAVTMARTRRLKGRLKAILSSKTPRGPIRGWKNSMVLGPLLGGACAAGLVVPVVERIPVKLKNPPVASLNSPSTKIEDFVLAEPRTENSLPTEFSPEFMETKANSRELPKAPKVPLTTISEDKGKQKITSSPGAIEINDGQGHSVSVSGDLNSNNDEKEDPKDMEIDMGDTMKDVDESIKESAESIRDAQKEMEKGLKQAQDEIAKSGMTGKQREMAEASLKFAKGIAGVSIKAAVDATKNLHIEFGDPKKKHPEKKPNSKPPTDKKQ